LGSGVAAGCPCYETHNLWLLIIVSSKAGRIKLCRHNNSLRKTVIKLCSERRLWRGFLPAVDHPDIDSRLSATSGQDNQ